MQKYKTAILYTVLIILGFIFAISRIQPTIVQIIDVEKNIGSQKKLTKEYQVRLDELKRAEMEKGLNQGQIKNIYKPEVSGTDAETSFSLLFDDIIDMSKYNGIKIYSIEYVYNPQDDEFVAGAVDKYNVCQVNMSLISDYTDLESFLKELYKYPYLLNIDKLELTPYSKNKKILLTGLQLKLYSSR